MLCASSKTKAALLLNRIMHVNHLTSCKLDYILQQETVLVYLMKFLMINTSAVVVHAVSFGFFFNLFPEIIQWGLDRFPNLTCSITVNEMYTVLMSYCFLAILVFKALAIFSPAYYLSMNHVKMWKWTFSLISVLWFLEYLIILLSYKTLCTKHNIYNLQTFRNLSVNGSDTELNEKPPTLFLHSALVFILRILISLVVLYKKKSIVKIFYKINPSFKRIAPLRRISNGIIDQRNDSIPFNLITSDTALAALKRTNNQSNAGMSSDDNFENAEDSNKDKYGIQDDIDVVEVLSELKITVELLPTPILVKEIDSSDSDVLDIDLVQALKECNTYEVSSKNTKEDFKLKEFLNKDKSENYTLNSTSENILEKDLKDSNNFEHTVDPDKIDIVISTNTNQDGSTHNLTKNGPESVKSNQNFRQLLLNTDIAIWIGTLGLVLAIFTVFINSHNNSIIIIHHFIGKVFFLALPPYWILRSEDKTLFALRRLERLLNWHGDY